MSQQLTLTRIETLRVLSCMGIDLPAHTKLPDDALEKRLRQALNASQVLLTVTSSPVLDILSFSRRPSNKKQTVFDAIGRASMAEYGAIMAKRAMGLSTVDPLRVDPFDDVRQTVMHLAKNWDEGYKVLLVTDPQQSEAEKVPINIRVRSVVLSMWSIH